jgi:type II secretory pathway component PulF
MTAEDLAALNDEIAGMARAGLPLDQGLAALAREMGRGHLQSVTAALAEDLRAGRTLPEALDRQGNRVPPYYAGLVAAGVRTGRIGEVLATLTTYARTLSNLRSIVADALFYPIVVLAFAVTLVGLMFTFIVPQFEQIFRDFGMKLPAITEMVLLIGQNALWWFVVPALVIVVGVGLARFLLRRTAAGQRAWARLIYMVPIFGSLVRAARLAAFTDLLAILVDHDLPLPEAFRLAGAASSDPLMAEASRQLHDDLSQGMPLAQAMRGRGLTPEWVAWMAGLGERRGTLGASLHQVADMYRRQVELRANLLRSVLPPFVIIGTAGIFTTCFVFALMLPLIKLLEGLSK